MKKILIALILLLPLTVLAARPGTWLELDDGSILVFSDDSVVETTIYYATDWKIGSGETYETIAAAISDGWYMVPDDTVTITSFTGKHFHWTAAQDGTSGHLITVDLSALTGLETLVFNGNYFHLIVPSNVLIKVSGTGITIDGRE